MNREAAALGHPGYTFSAAKAERFGIATCKEKVKMVLIEAKRRRPKQDPAQRRDRNGGG